ncbi:Hpt domain-containing protein [Jiella sp. CQZ9-1]|uniref:Hpt domain-containing protein n=2 Tax=Jiella flava TaxID=2816857 RepID=A0A939JRQ4_9HYPH|nr:Hpt domain-containing protein [Jiella flava]
MTAQPSKTDLIDAKLRTLTEKFRTSTLGDIERLHEIVRDTDSEVGPRRDGMRRIAHSLAGRAGTFGFPKITAAAAELEDAIVAGQEDLEGLLQRLTAAVESELTTETVTTGG